MRQRRREPRLRSQRVTCTAQTVRLRGRLAKLVAFCKPSESRCRFKEQEAYMGVLERAERRTIAELQYGNGTEYNIIRSMSLKEMASTGRRLLHVFNIQGIFSLETTPKVA
jgi:hypothetical protein